MRKFVLFSTLAIILAIFLVRIILAPAYDIIIYGGGFAGCAAARNAAAAAPDKKILLIVPDTSQCLGGLGTAGGQNFADIRTWRGQLVTAGSFGRWYEQAGQFYNTLAMSEIIAADLSQFKNLTVMYSQDIRNVRVEEGLIKSLVLAPITRNDEGIVQWNGSERKISGRIFIDASDEGKLAALSGADLTVGREDWPEQYLSADEKENQALQQAATLMFKVKGVRTPETPARIGDMDFVKDGKGSWGLVGGKETWANNEIVLNFNRTYGPEGFAIKPVNAAQDGAGSGEWWVNMLLVFNVDGRVHARDLAAGTAFAENQVRGKNHDQAWVKARQFLAQPDFLEALRQFRVATSEGKYGFAQAELVYAQDGLPQVGDVMYIRESVHGISRNSREQASSRATAGRENEVFALTTTEVQHAGSAAADGADQDNYQQRIGLGYYLMDINAYRFEDLQQEGLYQWPVTGNLRSDWQEQGGQPVNPVYLPFDMLLNYKVKNLLIPGYATGSSSMAWAEIRVLPNLAVLGDAAGVAAARAVLNKEWPVDFGPPQIEWIQTKLLQFGARLDK